MGEDEDYGSARIRVVLDDSGAVADARDLGIRIQRALDRATRGLGAEIRRNIQRGLNAAAVTVRVAPDLRGFNRALQAEIRARRDGVQIPVAPDLRRFNRGLIEGLNGLDGINIPIIPDLRRFDRELVRGLRELEGIRIPIIPDLRRFERLLRAGIRDFEGVRVPVIPDMRRFDTLVRRHTAPDVNVRANPDVDSFKKALTQVVAVAGTVGSIVANALKFGAIGVAAAGAAQGVGALVAALAPAAGIIAAYPAAIAGFQVALGTLKLALFGVGDAISAAFGDDAAKFQEALDKLAPAAQKAVLAVRDLAPDLKAVQQAVQQSFFSQFAGQISGAVRNLLPLRAGLVGVAAEFGKAASEGLRFAASQQALAPLQTIIQGTTQAVSGLQVAIAPVAKGFLDIAAAVSQAFGSQVGGAIAKLGAQFGTWLSTVAASGRAVDWVRGALDVFRQLGAIAANVGGIISSVFRAAGDAGGGLLNNVKTITASFREFASSAQGQSALKNVFSAVATVAARLGPIIASLVKQVGNLAPALVPVISKLGEAVAVLLDGLDLRAVAEGLSPVADGLLKAIRLIAPALKPVAEALGGLLASVSPLLPVIGRLVALVGKELAFTVKALTPVIKLLSEWLAAALTPVIELAEGGFRILAGAVKAAWSVLGPFVKLAGGALVAALQKLSQSGIISGFFDKLAGALRKLRPFFDAVAPAAAQLARDLKKLGQDVLAQLLPALRRLKTEVAPSLAPLKKLGGDAMRELAQGAAFAGRSVAALLTKLAPLARDVLKAMKPVAQLALAFLRMHVLDGLPQKIDILAAAVRSFGSDLQGAVSGAISFVGKVINAFKLLYDVLVGHSIIPDLINAIAQWFAQLPGQVLGIVSQFVTDAVTWFAQLPSQIMLSLSQLGVTLQTSISAGLTSVSVTLQTWGAGLLNWFMSLPLQIWTATSSLGSYLVSRFNAAFETARAAVSAAFIWLSATFATLPSRIGGALATLPGKLSSLFRTAGTAALNVARSIGTSVVTFFAGLPSRIGGAISSLIGTISGVFRRAGSAAISAVRSMVSTVVGFLRGLPSKVSDALSGAQSALVAAGRQMIQGMINGVQAMAGQLVSAAKSVVGSAVSAAKSALGIRSPSRVFAAIGRDTGKGFIVGLTGTASQIKQTTDKIAREITQAFKGQTTRVDDRLVTMVKDGNAKLQKLTAQRDKLVQRIADAQKFAAETKNAALSAFSLQSLTQGTENLTGATIVNGLKDAVAQVKAFSSQIDTLRKRGLRKDLLEQIIQMGPEAGAEIARTLSRQSGAALKEINQLQGQLVSESDQLGKLAANALYDAGKEAGRGLLEGLKGQKKDIEQLMLDIAKSMQRSIRTALRIKSPSRVFAEIGDQTGAGLQVGLTSRISALEKAARAAARAVVDTVSGQFAVLPGRIGSSLSGISDVRTPVIAPLTRSQRIRQQAEQGGLIASVAGPRNAAPQPAPVQAGGATITNHWTIHEAGDAHMTAKRVLTRMTLAAGVV
ncbi:hypothetical protein [Streptomyces atratus]|uniref:hypothetical protein n=1 Tax=Streptomyces atratus TaxID=1893 RepID=UPI00365750C6